MSDMALTPFRRLSRRARRKQEQQRVQAQEDLADVRLSAAELAVQDLRERAAKVSRTLDGCPDFWGDQIHRLIRGA